MICPRCGTPADGRSKICPECGVIIAESFPKICEFDGDTPHIGKRPEGIMPEGARARALTKKSFEVTVSERTRRSAETEKRKPAFDVSRVSSDIEEALNPTPTSEKTPAPEKTADKSSSDDALLSDIESLLGVKSEAKSDDTADEIDLSRDIEALLGGTEMASVKDAAGDGTRYAKKEAPVTAPSDTEVSTAKSMSGASSDTTPKKPTESASTTEGPSVTAIPKQSGSSTTTKPTGAGTRTTGSAGNSGTSSSGTNTSSSGTNTRVKTTITTVGSAGSNGTSTSKKTTGGTSARTSSSRKKHLSDGNKGHVGMFTAIWYSIIRMFDFNGRSSRSEYWWGILFTYVLTMASAQALSSTESVIWGIFSLIGLIASTSLCVRRYHDIGKPWYHILKSLIPYLGFFLIIVDFIKPSDGKNKWGYDNH